jgi:uncharacterized membrane protein YtjA (UPF0391 family)
MELLLWALVAFVIAIIAGALGFGRVSSGAATVGKVLFGIFLIIALVLIVMAVAGVSLLA